MADVRPMCPSCGSSGQILTVDRRTYVPCDHPDCAWRGTAGVAAACEQVLRVPAGSYPATVSFSVERALTDGSSPAEGTAVRVEQEALPIDEQIRYRNAFEHIVDELTIVRYREGSADVGDATLVTWGRVMRIVEGIAAKLDIPRMPSLDEIFRREPNKYLTQSMEHLLADSWGCMQVTPPPGFTFYSAKSLVVWPPSPDLLIESVCIGPEQIHANVESIAGWRSPLDMEGICFSHAAFDRPLSVTLRTRRNPVPLVAVIVTGKPESTLSPNDPRNPWHRDRMRRR